jgi:hypothetical protein
VAWLGTVCTQKATGDAPSVVSGTGVSTGGRTEWQVIAHEIGHNLGAIVSASEITFTMLTSQQHDVWTFPIFRSLH